MFDLTLIRAESAMTTLHETYSECRKPENVEGQLDMGTTFDCFSVIASTATLSISNAAKSNRAILQQAIERRGFKNYPQKWWHFSLNDEPFKTKFFDFEVQ